MRTGILLGILSVVTLGEYTVRFNLFSGSIHCIVTGINRVGFHTITKISCHFCIVRIERIPRICPNLGRVR